MHLNDGLISRNIEVMKVMDYYCSRLRNCEVDAKKTVMLTYKNNRRQVITYSMFESLHMRVRDGTTNTRKE